MLRIRRPPMQSGLAAISRLAVNRIRWTRSELHARDDKAIPIPTFKSQFQRPYATKSSEPVSDTSNEHQEAQDGAATAPPVRKPTFDLDTLLPKLRAYLVQLDSLDLPKNTPLPAISTKSSLTVFTHPSYFKGAIAGPGGSFEAAYPVNNFKIFALRGDTLLTDLLLDLLSIRYPHLTAKAINTFRSALTRNVALAHIAAAYGLPQRLRCNANYDSTDAHPSSDSVKVRAGIFEALLHALRSDAGLEAVRSLVHALFTPMVDLVHQDLIGTSRHNLTADEQYSALKVLEAELKASSPPSKPGSKPTKAQSTSKASKISKVSLPNLAPHVPEDSLGLRPFTLVTCLHGASLIVLGHKKARRKENIRIDRIRQKASRERMSEEAKADAKLKADVKARARAAIKMKAKAVAKEKALVRKDAKAKAQTEAQIKASTQSRIAKARAAATSKLVSNDQK